MSTSGQSVEKSWDYKNRPISSLILKILMIVIIMFLLIDISYLKLYDLLPKITFLFEKKVLATSLASLFIFSQIFIYLYINSQNISFLKIGQFRIIHLAILVANGILSLLIIKVIVDIWLNSYYEILPVNVIVCLSYGLGITTTGYLSFRFLIWFKSRHDKSILLYFLSTALIATTALIILIFLNSVLNLHTLGVPRFGGTALSLNIFQINLVSASNALSTTAFITTWLATAVLLNYRSRIVGYAKYWIIISLPLVYFLSQFLSLFTDIFLPLFRDDPVFFGIILSTIFTFSKLVGGILFGFAFWTMAKTIAAELELPKNLIRLAGYGYVILFMSTQTISFSVIPYPPYGVFTILFYGLASYMILVGVYFTVTVISQDSKIRSMVKRATETEPSLISDISYAQLEHVIEKRTMRLVKKMTTDSLSQSLPPQPDIEDIKSYTLSIINEIQSYNEPYKTIIERVKEMFPPSQNFLICISSNSLKILANNFLNLFKSQGEPDRKKMNKRIGIITSINLTTIKIVEELLTLKIEIKHISSLNFKEFIISEVEILEIVSSEDNKPSLEKTNDPLSVSRYLKLFEDLWTESTDAAEQIKKLKVNLSMDQFNEPGTIQPEKNY
jgi:hypothetical protein